MIIKEKGKKTRYYYYKKKIGRHKKPGPKPKKIKKERTYLKWDYKIVIVSNKRQIGYVNKYYSIEKAIDALKTLKENNDKIIFPVKYLNYKTIKPAAYEYLLLKRNTENKKSSSLHNAYGKLTENIIINNENWIIYAKEPKLIEETLWVYGYNPHSQRKTFLWIFENLILKILNENDNELLRVISFKNKIIIKKDNNDIELIICKNISDSVRLYNLIEHYSKEYKLSRIFFIGNADNISNFRTLLINDIINKTHWPIKKITRSSTRP